LIFFNILFGNLLDPNLACIIKAKNILLISNHVFNSIYVQSLNRFIDIVQNMNNNIDMKKINQQQFDVLRKISKKPSANQRELASELEISLGKLNFVLKGLKKNGLIKIRNFKKNPNKSRYLYLLTPKGIAEKTDLTINFMKRKMEEYDELREELKKGKNVGNNKI
tara:strand:- start:410 stop:907 length:498 start_codon:yes stop_codon:yes gene_type:complete